MSNSGDQQSDSFFAIQIGVFKEHQNAKIYIEEASKTLGEPVKILFNEMDSMYKCIVGEYKQMEDAKDKLFEIRRYYPDTFIRSIEK